jgi:subtilisin family serine protease
MHFRSPITLVLGTVLLASACDTPTEFGARQADVITAEKTLLVGFAQAPGAAEEALVASFGGVVEHRFKYVPVLQVRIAADREAALAAAAGVAYVSQNQPIELYGGKQYSDWGVEKIDAPGAWAAGYKGQGVKVAIFDTGIDLDHPDLEVVGGYSVFPDEPSLDDCNGHGTHVAGIVGARNNGQNTVGVAPRVQLYAVRQFNCAGSGAGVAGLMRGLEWAIDNGIQVINMSLGFGLGTAGVFMPTPGLIPPNAAADAAFAAAYQAGIVLVAASGNSAQGAPQSQNLPYISYPASHPDVIAVGATDDFDMLSAFSQWGDDQEVTAPGVTNYSSWLVGLGKTATVLVPTDAGREVSGVPLAFASETGSKGLQAPAIYANAGSPLDYVAQPCTGKIAVVTRGGPTFAQKAEFAKDAGCAGLIIHNNLTGNFSGTLGAALDPKGRPWLPVVSVSLSEGLYLREQIGARPTTLYLALTPGNINSISGTSMASPHVAGVAALILSRNPGWTPAQVREKLRSSSDDLGTPGWDPVFGHGRVNARKAVQ